jgi:8-oxo-dGTP pyrophosphatase MutT (NUDIX family)
MGVGSDSGSRGVFEGMSKRDGFRHHLAVMVYKLLPRSLSSVGVRILKATWPIGVVAVVFDESNRLLMLKHRYHEPAWRLPGGLMDRGEPPMETAIREVLEEANCVICPVAVVDAASTKYTFDVAVLAKLRQQDPFIPNAEILAYRWSDAEDVLPLLVPVQRKFVESALQILNRS